jgi:hypothetical protein
VKNSTKALTVVAAIGLLVAMFGLTTLFSAVDVEEDEVEWTMENGDDLAFVKADATYDFYIEDDALETISTETVHFHDHAASSTVFNVAERTTDQTPNPRVEAPATSGYDRVNPGATPWVTDALPIVRVGGNRVSAFTVNEDTGVVTLNDQTAETVSITFSYHTQDVYGDGVSEAEPGGETSQTTGRARVTSTSDSGGELVEISEAMAVGRSNASPTSKVFHGSVVLSSDASKAGSGDGEVWIEDGDTVTVDYLDEDGELIDSDTVTADTVPPTISDISPEDGSVSNSEHPTITFDVTDAGSKIASGAAITIMVRGRNVDTVQQPAFQPISDGFRAIFATGKSWTLASNFNVPDDDTRDFNWTIVAYDVAGNKAEETDSPEVSGDELSLRIDTNRPKVTAAVTGTAWDTSGTTPEEKKGVNTAVKVSFSENLDASSVDASDFTVDGEEPVAAAVGTKVGDDPDEDFRNQVYLTVDELDPDAKPVVKVVDDIEDVAGNELDTDKKQDAERTASDDLSPAITVTVSAALLVEDDEVKVTVDSNEKLSTAAGVTAYVHGPSNVDENGRLNTKSPRPLVHEGSLTASGAAASTGMYGVSIQAQDVARNDSNNLTKVTDEEVDEGGATLTLEKGPIGDVNFDGALDGDDVMVTVGGAAVGITSVDASARTVVINPGLGDGQTAMVTYHYVKDDTFEIDNSAPSVVITPVNEDEVEEAETIFISLDFDEDEYPGDSFKEVWLTKVEIENPDGSTTDLLAAGSFVTSDNMEFIWSAPGLALGDYTLTVMAKDDAGNEMAAQSSMFTVVAREPHEIGLRPGWNLISLPGMPADPDINAVIMEDDVDVVLTYDPAEGAWMVATRGPDGTFSGSLEMVDNTRAYWVHTDTFDPIKVDIPGFQAGSRSVPPEFAVMKGWNLVPVAVLDMESVEDGMLDANDYFTSVDWTRAYGYDNEMNRFESISLGDPDGMVKVGQGYWLHVESDGILAP